MITTFVTLYLLVPPPKISFFFSNFIFKDLNTKTYVLYLIGHTNHSYLVPIDEIVFPSLDKISSTVRTANISQLGKTTVTNFLLTARYLTRGVS